MAHEIFGQRFYSRGETPWHGIGVVNNQDQTARETFERFHYDVTLEPLVTVSGLPTNLSAIVRLPTDDDPEPRVLGTCSQEYELLRPQEIVSLWDEAVRAPVETLGALYQGAVLFITAKLPTIQVRGDEVRNFLLLVSPMTGNQALRVRTVPERVVCANTLRLAEARAVETHRVVHDRHARLKLLAALDGLYARATSRVAQYQELFDLMANRRLTEAEVNFLLEEIYMIEPLDVDGLPETIRQQRTLSWEMTRDYQLSRRQQAREVFEGRGVGSDTPAFKGTAWGLVNAVSELEQWSGRSRGRAQIQNILDGYRGQVMERAATVIERYVTSRP